MGANSGLLSMDEYKARKQEERERKRDRRDERQDDDLTDDERARAKVLSYCARLYDEARTAREPHETFDTAWDLYIGNVFPRSWPNWRAKITINKIRAFITFMQAIMTDNKPRMSVEPRVDGSEDAADLLRKLVDRDWDENDMQQKLSQFVLHGLIWGTAFMKITYDPYADGGRGRHLATPIVPYRIYTNRTATCIEDAEYIIHRDEVTMGWIRRNFPDRANHVYKVRGMRTVDKREGDRDYILEGDASEQQRIVSAQNVNGNITPPMYAQPYFMDDDGDSVEILEYWMRDDSLEQYERQVVRDGVALTEPVVEDGMYVLEVAGKKVEFSEIDGQPFLADTYKPKMKPVMESAWRMKYPNGRLVIVAGGKCLLRDVPAPFQVDGFPFAMWKDYDVGGFWGQGEPLALKDCAVALNRVVSQVYDILEKTGNPSYILKKGAGVNASSIKARPGQVIPMDEMDALKPLDKPVIPQQFMELFGVLRSAMGEISGVNDSVMGQLPAANTAFATMDQLQESGAAPIRLKVRNLESGIRRMGKLRVALIQQWDNGRQPIRERNESEPQLDDEGNEIVQPVKSVDVQFRSYAKADLQGQVEFGVVPISSLSTSPAGTWNRFMDLYSKHLIDRRWWHQKFRIEGWRTELPRMEKQEKEDAMAAAAAKQAGKPGPAPRSTSTNRSRNAKQQAPASHVPSRTQNAAVR